MNIEWPARHIGVRLRRTVLAAACLCALPGGAFAADSRAELEQRVSQLEQQVQALLAELREQKEAEALAKTALPPPPAAGAKPPIQTTTITPGASPDTTFRVTGFVKADFMATRTDSGQLADNAVGRALYVPTQIPVGGGSSGTDFDAHAKFSRLGFGVDTVTGDGTKAGAYLEMDFFGNALGTQTATNTYGVTVRHAYAFWGKWLAGQTWTNFGDVGALPETVDFIGPTDGLIFSRQAQVRYTSGPISLSLENPETMIIPYRGGATTASDRGLMPDFTARYATKGDWGTFGVAALLRNLRVDRPAAGTTAAVRDTAFAGALTVGGKFVLGKSDDIRYQLTAGSGFARYIGLGIHGDAVLDAGGDLETIGGIAGWIAWRHAFTPKLRTNLVYARSDWDNDTALTGTTANQSFQSLRGNVFYTPFPKVDVGAELMVGKRELESGASGKETRLQVTTKYSF